MARNTTSTPSSSRSGALCNSLDEEMPQVGHTQQMSVHLAETLPSRAGPKDRPDRQRWVRREQAQQFATGVSGSPHDRCDLTHSQNYTELRIHFTMARCARQRRSPARPPRLPLPAPGRPRREVSVRSGARRRMANANERLPAASCSPT